MLSTEDILSLGWKDMSPLNPQETYPVPTFGFNIRNERVSELRMQTLAEYFMRFNSPALDTHNIYIWTVGDRISRFTNVFCGNVENKYELMVLMRQLNIKKV